MRNNADRETVMVNFLKLDPQDRVPNSSLTLSDVRRMAASVVR